MPPIRLRGRWPINSYLQTLTNQKKKKQSRQQLLILAFFAMAGPATCKLQTAT